MTEVSYGMSETSHEAIARHNSENSPEMEALAEGVRRGRFQNMV